ncbi:hypothetical protein [Spirosoma radiotolerans]|nr:hypothetical protein [Spirosoma radiotolerans]
MKRKDRLKLVHPDDRLRGQCIEVVQFSGPPTSYVYPIDWGS